MAVHAMVFLRRKGSPATSQELAESICTNPARVRKVLSALHRAGLVLAREGRGSGYEALPGGGAITLLQVLDAVGDPVVPEVWRTGDLDRDCLVCSGMGPWMDGLRGGLEALCRGRMEQITVEEVMERLLEPGEGKT